MSKNTFKEFPISSWAVRKSNYHIPTDDHYHLDWAFLFPVSS